MMKTCCSWSRLEFLFFFFNEHKRTDSCCLISLFIALVYIQRTGTRNGLINAFSINFFFQVGSQVRCDFDHQKFFGVL